MLKSVGLSKSTYYYEINHTSFDDKKNQDIMNEINNIFNENKKRYGVRRIHKELLNRGHSINHKKVQRLMHKMGLSGKQPKLIEVNNWYFNLQNYIPSLKEWSDQIAKDKATISENEGKITVLK